MGYKISDRFIERHYDTNSVQFCYVHRIYCIVRPDRNAVPEQGSDRGRQYSGRLLPAGYVDLHYEQAERTRSISWLFCHDGLWRSRSIRK